MKIKKCKVFVFTIRDIPTVYICVCEEFLSISPAEDYKRSHILRGRPTLI